VIGLVFAWSFVSKVRNTSAFLQTIRQFQILSARLTRPVGYLFLFGEIAVALSMVVGNKLLSWGFLLGTFLLTLFCVALSSVLLRKVETSCNCFGASRSPVSYFDLVRNIGLIGCSLGGYSALTATRTSLAFFSWPDNILVILAATVFVVLWVQLGEIVRLFR